MAEEIKQPTPEVVDPVTPPVVETPSVEDKKDTTDTDDKKDKPEERKKEPETKEPEKKEPEKQEEKVDVAGLQAEIARLQGELAKAQDNNDSKVAIEQANALLNVQKNLASEYEGVLNEIIEAKLQEIPENLRELVPANLSVVEKMDWLTKAEKSGVFKTSNPDVEIGKPLNPNNVKQQTDTSKLSASAIMALAYGNSKGKGKK